MDRFTFFADSIAASMHDVVHYYVDEESKEGGGDWTSLMLFVMKFGSPLHT